MNDVPREKPLAIYRRMAVDATLGTEAGDLLDTHWRMLRFVCLVAVAALIALIVLCSRLQVATALHLRCVTVEGPTADARVEGNAMPTSATLQLQMRVDQRALLFVEPGTPVRIVFEALEAVGADDLIVHVEHLTYAAPPAGETISSMRLSAPVFEATATLPPELRLRNGAVVQLRPGMIASGIVTGPSQTLLSWALGSTFRRNASPST